MKGVIGKKSLILERFLTLWNEELLTDLSTIVDKCVGP